MPDGPEKEKNIFCSNMAEHSCGQKNRDGLHIHGKIEYFKPLFGAWFLFYGGNKVSPITYAWRLFLAYQMPIKHISGQTNIIIFIVVLPHTELITRI